MGKLVVVVALVVLTACGRLTGGAEAVSDAGAGSSADTDSYGGGGDPACTVSSSGQRICPKPGQRSAEWDTYAIADNGRTVSVTFTDRPSRCTEVDELSGEVLPTEIHLTLSLIDTQEGCEERVAREASVTLSEPVAGRPVYSGFFGDEGGGGSMGYAGAVEGPQCRGPGKPAPGAVVSDCPSPTSGPPPLKTVVSPDAKRSRPVPWTAVTVSDNDLRLELQWVSTACARLADVEITEDADSLLVTLAESRCNGEVVVRSTVVTLDEPLGRKTLIDGTQAVR